MGLIFVFFIVAILGIIAAVLRAIITLMVNLALDPVGTAIALVRVLTFGTAAIALIAHLMLHAHSALTVAIIAGVIWLATFVVPALRERQDNYEPEPAGYEQWQR